jgi:hypothetical protein
MRILVALVMTVLINASSHAQSREIDRLINGEDLCGDQGNITLEPFYEGRWTIAVRPHDDLSDDQLVSLAFLRAAEEAENIGASHIYAYRNRRVREPGIEWSLHPCIGTSRCNPRYRRRSERGYVLACRIVSFMYFREEDGNVPAQAELASPMLLNLRAEFPNGHPGDPAPASPSDPTSSALPMADVTEGD